MNLNKKKRQISVVADNVEVRNINSVKIKVNNHLKFPLCKIVDIIHAKETSQANHSEVARSLMAATSCTRPQG